MDENALTERAEALMLNFGEECPLVCFEKDKITHDWCKTNCSISTSLDCWKEAIRKGWI